MDICDVYSSFALFGGRVKELCLNLAIFCPMLTGALPCEGLVDINESEA